MQGQPANSTIRRSQTAVTPTKVARKYCFLGLLSVAACSGPPKQGPVADTADALPAGDGAYTVDVAPASARPTEISVPRGGKTAAAFHTLANAWCSLRKKSEAPGTSHLVLYSDSDGIARLHLSNTNANASRAEYLLDCTNEAGQIVTEEVDLTADDFAPAQDPLPYPREGKRKLARLDIDPMSISRAELLRRGYPPRPDPVTAPQQYAQWLALIATEPTVIDPHPIQTESNPSLARLEPKNTINSTSNIWSGFQIATPVTGAPFAEVFGELEVPPVSGAYDSSMYSAFWVGLESLGQDDVVQDGTRQNAYSDVVGFEWQNYEGWTEWWPAGPNILSNFPVNPNDTVYAWTWVGNSADGEGGGEPYLYQPFAQRVFGTPQPWYSQAFQSSSSHFAGDVNGDGLADVIAVGTANTWALLSNSAGFWPVQEWSTTNLSGTWATRLGDVNGDRKSDVVAFDSGGTYISLSTGSSFGGQVDYPWSFTGAIDVELADVDGNGAADLISFYSGATYVSLSNGSNFGSPTAWGIPFYGTYGQVTGDVNGDGKADCIAFDSANTYVMISEGSSFATPQIWWATPFYGSAPSYPSTRAGDINGDGLADVIAFDPTSTYVMLSNATYFGNGPEEWQTIGFYGTGGTVMGDVNGDGFSDAIAFNSTNIYVQLSSPAPSALSLQAETGNTGYFYLANFTQGYVTGVLETAQPSNAVFHGAGAEWIMEWPSQTGDGLADYGTAWINNPWASDYHGTYYYYTSATSWNLTMWDNNEPLSTVSAEGCCSMEFTWHNF